MHTQNEFIELYWHPPFEFGMSLIKAHKHRAHINRFTYAFMPKYINIFTCTRTRTHSTTAHAHTQRDFQYITIINDEQCGMPTTNLKRDENTSERRTKSVPKHWERVRERESERARDESVNTVNIWLTRAKWGEWGEFVFISICRRIEIGFFCVCCALLKC